MNRRELILSAVTTALPVGLPTLDPTDPTLGHQVFVWWFDDDGKSTTEQYVQEVSACLDSILREYKFVAWRTAPEWSSEVLDSGITWYKLRCRMVTRS